MSHQTAPPNEVADSLNPSATTSARAACVARIASESATHHPRRDPSYPRSAACAAARGAIGTRNGEHDT